MLLLEDGNGGMRTIFFRASVDDEHSSSERSDVKIRRKNEVNLAMMDISVQQRFEIHLLINQTNNHWGNPEKPLTRVATNASSRKTSRPQFTGRT